MSGETLRNRLHSATCDCGARDGDCAVGNDGIAVVAEWLREHAAQLRHSADAADNQTGRTILIIRAEAIDKLADSLTPTPAETTEEPT